jgi:hypothetical protein
VGETEDDYEGAIHELSLGIITNVHRELKRKHVTLTILWDEYIAENPGGYRYSRFCELYRIPEITQATVFDTVCTPGYTRSLRPYVGAMRDIKHRMLDDIGEPREHRNRYELDHRIPLALGGAPIDPRNLALQPWPEAREKDAIEVCLARAVCSGRVGLDEAREAIWTDWRSADHLCDQRRE